MLSSGWNTLDPKTEYQERVAVWRGKLEETGRVSNRMGYIRLAVALAGVLMAYLAFVRHDFAGWWLFAPAAVFTGLIVEHERVIKRQEFARRALGYYERGLRRLADSWAGTGSRGDEFADPSHVYSGDMDVFGKGSLFELISTARTAAGERTLADWLLNAADASEVRERQRGVQEMRDAVQLREDLALLGEDVRVGVHADLLARWGAAPPVRYFRGARAIAFVTGIANLVTFVLYMAHVVSLRPFAIALVLALAVGYALGHATEEITGASSAPGRDLQILALLLARLEHVRFESPLLRRIRSGLDTHGLPASRRIRGLERWVEMLDSSEHLLVRIIGPPLLWRQQSAMGVEAWRRKNGPAIGRWIQSIAEIEAVSSLASFSFEHPAASYPELVEDGPLFEADQLCHPLMSAVRCVPNDVALDGERRLLIVSGSNMSGKSTLLRSVGLNAVLAWAGAPVTASRLRISPVAVGASIRMVDSLLDGKSRFYAEITRLRQIVGLTGGAAPVLFLLDELLSGTNSHDRRIGAEAVIRTLIRRGGFGLVTTHDLALTEIEREFGGLAVNVHFEDHLEDGRISFDYKLKPGIVERSNALELMRAVGLEL